MSCEAEISSSGTLAGASAPDIGEFSAGNSPRSGELDFCVALFPCAMRLASAAKRTRRSSSLIKSMESLPPFSFGSIATRVPRAWVSSRSISNISGAYRYSFLRTLSNAMRRAIDSVSRTVSFLSIISRKSTLCSCGLSISINSGRVWPSEIFPSESACCISGVSVRSRMVLETYSRLLPTFSATCPCLNPNSFTKRANACARSIGFRSSRWRFSMIATSSFVLSSS